MDPLYLEALATLETANGRKTIKGPKGEDSFNLYNIKDFSGKGFRAVDKAEGSNDAYRTYASREESTADLIGLLSRKYPAALEADDPVQFASALKAGGYATDPAYVEKFARVYQDLLGRGGAPQAPELPTPQPAADRSLEALYAAAQGPRPPKRMALTKTAAAVGALASIQPLRTAASDTEDAWFTRATAQEQDAKKAKAEADQQGVLDIARAQFMQTFGGTLLKRFARPEFMPDGVPVTEEELIGYTVEEQDAIRAGASKAERDYLRFEIDNARDNLREAGKSGLGWAIAGGMIAGAPEAIAAGGLTTALLARAGLGSLALAEQGRRAAGIASLAAENLLPGAAMTAAQDYLTPDVHLQDYIIGALGDSLGMALHAPRVLGASRKVEADALHAILNDAAQSKKADIDAARVKLGPDATPAEVNKAAVAAQAERVRTELETHRATLPADRKLIPDDVNEELFGEGAGAKADAPQADATQAFVSETTGLDERLINPAHSNYGVVSPSILDEPSLRTVGSSTESNLAAGWRRDNPHGARSIAEFERDFGANYDGVLRDAPERSVHLVNADRVTAEQSKLAMWLHKTFLPGLRVALMDLDTLPIGKAAPAVNGYAWDIGSDISLVAFRSSSADWQRTLLHEFGHIIFNRSVHRVKQATKDGFMAVHDAWLKKYSGADDALPAQGLSKATDAAVRRGTSTSPAVMATIGVKAPLGFIPTMMDVMLGVVRKASLDFGLPNRQRGAEYIPSVKEFSAEQFTKYIEAAAADVLDWKPASLPASVKQFFAALWDEFATLFNRVKQAGLLAPEEGVVNFFEEVRKSAKATETVRRRVAEGKPAYRDSWDTDAPLSGPDRLMTTPGPAGRSDDDIIRDYGLDRLAAAGNSGAQRARLKAMVHLYRKAEAYPMPDEARMSKLLSSSPMQWAAPTALTLLKSKNPVARMAAAELLESGGGAGGRRSTAAIAKYIHEREFMGNTVNDFQRHYTAWRNANGGGTWEDFWHGRKFEEFNRLVATELENRHQGREVNAPQAVKDAADVLSAAYDRMRVKQQQLKTPGWAALPADSYGYMPHRMSPGKVRAMSPDQGRVLHSVLAEQFEQIEGFDAAFSRQLASKYIDIMVKRGTAGYSAPIGVHSAEAADIVEQSALAMGMSQAEANALAKRVLRSAPKHTQHRLQLDLTRTYEADGRQFQLLDLFETDQLTLLRSQVGRVSGEAALVRHGIMGSAGMKLLRDALSFGTADGKAANAELEAFDQVSAELLGAPFGKQPGKWMDRALQFNALASLGGMGFNQLAETLNGAVALGVRHALASVGSFRRLRAEILALSKGQQVNNPIIGSLETYGGAQFGTDHYKLVFPFDRPGHGHEVYGAETLQVADRLLRAGSHLQGKLSLWRAISSAQERGMAEQIVHKALRYINDIEFTPAGTVSRMGGEKALADMGIGIDLIRAIKSELHNAARFDGRGRLVEFDITRLENREAANAFVQAVHRGTRQIIQGSFIGETGKWAHHGLLKMMTQFRTFSLVAIDKQWNRQVGNHGTATALGILLGTMSFAAPIVMIRAGLASVGRPDQDEYLARRLHPVNIARETLNYVALSGMAGDLLDALAAVSGYQPTGGRTGTNKSFVGNVVAPAVGKANDLWGAVQNTRDGTDIHGLVQQLPFARLPWLYPAVNALKRE